MAHGEGSGCRVERSESWGPFCSGRGGGRRVSRPGESPTRGGTAASARAALMSTPERVSTWGLPRGTMQSTLSGGRNPSRRAPRRRGRGGYRPREVLLLGWTPWTLGVTGQSAQSITRRSSPYLGVHLSPTRGDRVEIRRLRDREAASPGTRRRAVETLRDFPGSYPSSAQRTGARGSMSPMYDGPLAGVGGGRVRSQRHFSARRVVRPALADSLGSFSLTVLCLSHDSFNGDIHGPRPAFRAGWTRPRHSPVLRAGGPDSEGWDWGSAYAVLAGS